MTVSSAYVGLFMGEGKSGGKCPDTLLHVAELCIPYSAETTPIWMQFCTGLETHQNTPHIMYHIISV